MDTSQLAASLNRAPPREGRLRCCFQPQPPRYAAKQRHHSADQGPASHAGALRGRTRCRLFGSSQSAPSAGPSGPAEGNVAYLPRDVPQGDGLGALGPSPAALGVFLVNEADSRGRCSGHTIRVCETRGGGGLLHRRSGGDEVLSPAPPGLPGGFGPGSNPWRDEWGDDFLSGGDSMGSFHCQSIDTYLPLLVVSGRFQADAVRGGNLLRDGNLGLENRCSIQLSYHRIFAQGRVSVASSSDKGKTTLDSLSSDSTFRSLSYLTGW